MDVFKLAATLGLNTDEYDKGLEDAGGKASSLGDALTNAAKIAGVALAAAATGIAAVTKQAVSAYADYEQNVGGIQKLYGNMGMSLEEYAASTGKTISEVQGEWQNLETAQNMVLQNASNAYKTAGMSANEYMETATGFSAALINSLGGDSVAAAEATDVAMRAISDNWNTFGGDIEGIKTAYQGFAKQNYTMLDNLKLGYGGTKEEMERLIEDANEYGKSIGLAGDLSIDSFADVVTAIDLVQQKQNIAGTTAREAATTISGSLGMTKAAWDNLLVGLADGEANLDELIDNMIESIVGYTDETGEHVNGLLDNVLPVIEQVLVGMGELVSGVVPMLVEMLPGLIEELLPPLLEAAISLVAGLLEALPEILQALITVVPQLVSDLIQAFIELAPEFLTASIEIIGQLAQGLIDNLPTVITGLTSLVTGMIAYIQQNLPQFLQQGIGIVLQLIQGLMNSLPQIIQALTQILVMLIETIVQNLPQYLEMGIQLILSIIQGIIAALPQIVQAIVQLVSSLLQTITQNLPQFLQTGVELVMQLIVGLIQALPDLISNAGELVSGLMNVILETDWLSLGWDIISGIATGIANSAGQLLSALWDAVKAAWDTVLGWLGIASPSKRARDIIGKNWALGIGVGFEQNMPTKQIVGAVEDAFDEIEGLDEPLLASESGSVVDRIAVEGEDSSGYPADNVTINVYGAEGQDVTELAEEVQRLFVLWENQRRASFA